MSSRHASLTGHAGTRLQVLILRCGKYDHMTGVVQSMANGYLKVCAADGSKLNLRAKECSLLATAPAPPRPPARAALADPAAV